MFEFVLVFFFATRKFKYNILDIIMEVYGSVCVYWAKMSSMIVVVEFEC